MIIHFNSKAMYYTSIPTIAVIQKLQNLFKQSDGFTSCHITPLVINSLGGNTHTHTYTHTHTHTHKQTHTHTTHTHIILWLVI